MDIMCLSNALGNFSTALHLCSVLLLGSLGELLLEG
jgi:hypothetical protein